MLDKVNTAAQSEDLGEHKVQTELDRLTQNEIAAFAAARTRRNKAETDAAVKAALAAEAGTRYTAPELAAACGAAISLALRGTRSMRLTSDDWSDLRSDLIVAALEHGAKQNIARGEAPSMMPRREDLAGKDKAEGLAYLSGTARRLLADLAADGASWRDRWGRTEEAEEAEHTEAEDADLTADDLAAHLAATTRERWAIKHAVETCPIADLAAVEGKTAHGMRESIHKGRKSLAAKVDAKALRAEAAEMRGTPIADLADLPPVVFIGRRPLRPSRYRPRPAAIMRPRTALPGRPAKLTRPSAALDVLRYIAEAEAAIVERPAALAEAAEARTRQTVEPRRNRPTPPAAPRMIREAPRPAIKWGRGRKGKVLPTEGPTRLTWHLADLPTIDRRAIRGRILWTAMATHRAKAPQGPSRPLSLASDLPLEGSCPLSLPAEHGRPDGDRMRPVPEHRRNPMGAKVTSPAVKHPRYAKSHAGMLTAEVTADLAARRLADLAARKAARLAERKAARKVTVLPAAEAAS